MLSILRPSALNLAFSHFDRNAKFFADEGVFPTRIMMRKGTEKKEPISAPFVSPVWALASLQTSQARAFSSSSVPLYC